MKRLLLLCITATIFACEGEPKNYVTLSGQIANPDESKTLKVFNRDNYEKIIELNDDGTFSDTLKVEAGDFNFQHGKEYGQIYLENDNETSLETDYESFIDSMVFKGDASDLNNFSDDNKFFKHIEFDRKVKRNKLNISFDIQESTQFIRIDPCHEAVMLSDELELIAHTIDEKQVKLTPIHMNHVDVVDGDILFPIDPQVTYQLPKAIIKITFCFCVKRIGDDLYPMYVSRYSALRSETDLLIDKYNKIKIDVEKCNTSTDVLVGDNIEKSKNLLDKLETLNSSCMSSAEYEKILLSLSILEDKLLSQINFERNRSLAFEEALAQLRFNSNKIISNHITEQKKLSYLLNKQEKKNLLDKSLLKEKLVSKQSLAKKIYQDKENLISELSDLKVEQDNLFTKIGLLENSKALKIARFFTWTKG